MKSMMWKFGIIAVFVILLHCVNEPPSTIHPVLNFRETIVNDTTRVILTTTVAEDYSLYRIIDDACFLQVSYHAVIDGMLGVVDSIDTVTNDSAAIKEGRFDGIWTTRDSLHLSNGVIPIDTIEVYGCVTDETGHEACDLILLVRDTTQNEIKYH
jgi:hypothetical protein